MRVLDHACRTCRSLLGGIVVPEHVGLAQQQEITLEYGRSMHDRCSVEHARRIVQRLNGRHTCLQPNHTMLWQNVIPGQRNHQAIASAANGRIFCLMAPITDQRPSFAQTVQRDTGTRVIVDANQMRHLGLQHHARSVLA